LGVLLMSITASAGALPDPVVPAGLGVNIHFTGEPARDLEMIQAAGFRFIRMDFIWEAIEREKGVYQFEAYDQLTAGLEKRGIRALYILDYSNPLYESDRSVRTAEGRQAFARFAAAAAARYRGRGILWELWNEPNIGFWVPQPSVDDYMALAKAVFPAIREADPEALRVAPATSGIPLDFLEACFRRGLLDLVDAVSVHPYRQSAPESVVPDYQRLRALIARYRPDRPDLPILSGEWGYSCVWEGFNDERQGQYLPRQFLTNLSEGIPVSIWYDWHDDGPDPKEPEHHFGTVTLDYQPKPAYQAMQRLVAALEGMRFVKRLQSDPADWLLLFADGERRALAVWTTGEAHEAEPIPGQKVRLTGDPQYLPVPASARAVLAEGAWRAAAQSVGVRGGAAPGEPLSPALTLTARNPFAEAVPVHFRVIPPDGARGRFEGPARFRLAPGEEKVLRWHGRLPRSATAETAVTVEATVAGHRHRQTVPLILTNCLSLAVVPEAEGGLAAVVRNPSGDAFTGTLTVQVGSTRHPFALKLSSAAGGLRAEVRGRSGPVPAMVEGDAVRVRLPAGSGDAARVLRATLREGRTLIADTGRIRWQPLPVSTETAAAHNDGDASVPATFTLTDTGPAPAGVRLSYDYGEGWKFVRIAPKQALPVEGKPVAMGVMVKGDGRGCLLRLRFVDANGRTFQAEYGALDFTGWRYLSAPLNNPRILHWGGTGDETRIAYPIRIDTLALVDNGKRTPVQGAVELAGFHLVYGE